MEEPAHYAQLPRPASGGKPFTRLIYKACFFALVVVIVPLFPSQAPDFITESVITKLWELIHLLFIGIAVSYGLFCRRNPDVEIDCVSKFDTLQYDMSRMFHVSSGLDEGGYENSCGLDKKRRMGSSPNGRCDESSLGTGSIQAWGSQYLQGEPMVVVARPNCGFGEHGESGLEADYKPLGLPVRSLNSRIGIGENKESSELVSGDESSLGSSGSVKSFNESRDETFGNRFEESVVSPFLMSWRSRSVTTEAKEKLSPVSRPRRFRPLSVDETQFESLGTMRPPSSRSTVSSSSRASSVSSSPGDDSLSYSAVSEVMNSKVVNEEKQTSLPASLASSGSTSSPKPKKRDAVKSGSFHGSSASGSPSPPKPMDDKASTSASHTRGYSFSSFNENELRIAKYLKELSDSRKEDVLDSHEPRSSSFKLNSKKASLRKSSLRGKSVRTVRSSETPIKVDNYGDLQGNPVDNHDIETVFLGKGSMNEGVDSQANRKISRSLDRPSHEPKHTIVNDRKEEIQGFAEAVSDITENTEIKADKFWFSTATGDTDTESVHGTKTPDSNEVDKKAGEFIAKFKEQIRLQKVASMERSRGMLFGAR